MRYLGGKSRLARRLVSAMRAEQGDAPVWEPFCGGLSMTVEFAKRSAGLATDAHPALISLYRSVRAGWIPPRVVTREMHTACKQLPDNDPLKAFVGFGCSFGGRWFGSYAENNPALWHYPAQEAARTLQRDIPAVARWSLDCASFFEYEPGPINGFIYCDPPYAGAYGYAGLPPFAHDEFWATCQQWARWAPVYVSERSCPIAHDVIVKTDAPVCLSGGTSSSRRPEHLFRIHPARARARVAP